MNENKDALGVDVGGVILDLMPYRETELSFQGDRYLETPAMKDAIASIAKLNASRFANRIFLVSRGPGGNGRILDWLRHQEFFSRTGIPEARFHSCTERHEKAEIVEKLGITHFIDDRAEVLGHMVGRVSNLYLFQSLDENPGDFKDIRVKLHLVHSWDELLGELA